MTVPNSDPTLITSLGVGAVAVLGGIAKGSQWRDAQTGKISYPAMVSGVALSLVMATVIRAAGVHYGWEPWVQCALSGVACYVGPDPILRALAGMALKRFGVNEDGNKPDAAKL
jgi:hypothetical protein